MRVAVCEPPCRSSGGGRIIVSRCTLMRGISAPVTGLAVPPCSRGAGVAADAARRAAARTVDSYPPFCAGFCPRSAAGAVKGCGPLITERQRKSRQPVASSLHLSGAQEREHAVGGADAGTQALIVQAHPDVGGAYTDSGLGHAEYSNRPSRSPGPLQAAVSRGGRRASRPLRRTGPRFRPGWRSATSWRARACPRTRAAPWWRSRWPRPSAGSRG